MSAASTRFLVGLVAVLAVPGMLHAQDTMTTQAASAQAPTVTLDEAIELALRVQPAVVQARGAVTNARWASREVTGSWLPQLSTNTSWTRSQVNTTYNADGIAFTPPANSYRLGWSASLTVFDGFQRLAQGRAARADYDNADASLTNQEFQVTLQVKQAFFNALAAQELLRVSETQIQRAQEQLNAAQEKLAAGSATRSDTLRSRVEVGNAQLARLNAQTQLATAEANLARLIGYDGPVRPVSDSSLFSMAPLDTAALRAEVLRTSPSVVAAEANAKAAEASVAVSRAQYFPSVSGSFNQNWTGTAVGAMDSRWSMGLTLRWTLFNGFTREGSYTRSKVARESAEAQAEDARRQASAQLTQQLASLESTRSQIDIARASQAAAEEDLRVVRERYRLGAATIVDVLTSQVTLDQAEVSVVQAQLNFLVAKAQLESLLGRTL